MSLGVDEQTGNTADVGQGQLTDAPVDFLPQTVTGPPQANPTAYARRAKLLLQTVPALQVDPVTLNALASQPVDDQTMVAGATKAISSAGWAKYSDYLDNSSPTAQQAAWNNADDVTKAGLMQAGYKGPPKPQSSSSSFLGSALHAVGTGLSDVVNLGGDVISPVGSPILHVLNDIGGAGAHWYRTMKDLEQQGNEGGVFASLPDLLAQGLTLGKWHPSQSIADAWKQTSNGESFYLDKTYNKASQLAADWQQSQDQALGAQNTGTVVNVAHDLASGMKLEDVVSKYANAPMGSPKWQQAAALVNQWTNDGNFQRIIHTFLDGKVSFGRTMADAFGAHGGPLHTIISGALDATVDVVLDPTQLVFEGSTAALEARRSVDLARLGLDTDAASKLLEQGGRANNAWHAYRTLIQAKYDKVSSVRRAFDTIAEHVSAGDWGQLQREVPSAMKYKDALVDYAAREGINSGRDVADFMGNADFLRTLLEGSEGRRGAEVLTLPFVSKVGVVGNALEDAARKTINWAADKPKVGRLITSGRISELAPEDVAAHIGETSPGAILSHGVLRVGQRTYNLNPMTALAELVQGMVTHTPKGDLLPLFNGDFADQLRRFTDMTSLADVPSWARDKWFDQIAGSTEAGRLDAYREVMGHFINMLPVSDPTQRELLGQQWVNLGKQQYDYYGQMLSGLLPHSDTAYAVGIPNFQTLGAQVQRTGFLRSWTGWVDNGWLDAMTSSYWKPAVLMRVGFIPRAVMEEGFSWLAQHPLAWPKALLNNSLATDTLDSFAGRVNSDLASRGISIAGGPSGLPRDLLDRFTGDLDSYGLTRMARRTQDYNGFNKAIMGLADENPELAQTWQTLRDNGWGRQFFNVTARPGQTLLWPFRMAAGVTGAIARPRWDDETALRDVLLRATSTDEATKAAALTELRGMGAGDNLLTGLPPALNDRGALQLAKKIVRDNGGLYGDIASNRRGMGIADPLVSLLHRASDVTPVPRWRMFEGADNGAVALDAAVRNIGQRVSLGSRTLARKMFSNPELVRLYNVARYDPMIQRGFYEHVGAAHAGWLDLANHQLVSLDMGHDVNGGMRFVFATRDRAAGFGTINRNEAQFVHALFTRTLHWSADPLGQALAERSLFHLNPELVAKFSGADPALLSAGAEHTDVAQRAVDGIHGFLDSMLQMPAETRETMLRALESNNPDAWDHVFAGLRAADLRGLEEGSAEHVAGEAALGGERAALDRIQSLSPGARMQLAGLARDADRNFVKGTGQFLTHDLTTDVDALRRAMHGDALETLSDPSIGSDLAKLQVSTKGAESGEPLANPIAPGQRRLYLPTVPQGMDPSAALQKLLAGEPGAPTAPIVYRSADGTMRHLADEAVPTLDGAHGTLPIGVTNYEQAQEMSRRVLDSTSASPPIAYIDVPEELVRGKYEREGGLLRRFWSPRVTDDNQAATPLFFGSRADGSRDQLTHELETYLGTTRAYRVEPAQLYNATYLTPNLNGADGARSVFLRVGNPGTEAELPTAGISAEQIRNEHARKAVDEWFKTFANDAGTRVNHELSLPPWMDQVNPLTDPATGRVIQRADPANLLDGAELPEKTFGPKYKIGVPNLWQRATTFGWDHVIGPAIDSVLRKPMFYDAYTRALAQQEYAGALNFLLPKDIFGDTRTEVHHTYQLQHLESTPGWEIANPAVRTVVGKDIGLQHMLATADHDSLFMQAMRNTHAWPEGVGITAEPLQSILERAPESSLDDPTAVSQFAKDLQSQGLELSQYAQDHFEELRAAARSAAQHPGELGDQARAIEEALDHVEFRDTPGGGERILLAPVNRPWIPEPVTRTVVTRGSIHDVLAHAQPHRTLDAVIHAGPVDVPDALHDIVGKLTPRQMLDRVKPDELLSKVEDARQAGLHPETANWIRDEVVPALHRTAGFDDRSIVDAWRSLPGTMRDPNIDPAYFRELARDQAPWAVGLHDGDLGTLRAADTALGHMQQIQRQGAMFRALDEITPFIVQHDLRSQWQGWMRNLVPFWFAQEQFLSRWARTIVENPAALRRAQLLIQSFTKDGIFRTDGNGNQYVVYPGTPALTSGIGHALSAITGKDYTVPVSALMTADTRYLTPGFDRMGVPGFSPMVAIGFNALSNHFPEMTDLRSDFLGTRGTNASVIASVLPPVLNRAWSALTPDHQGSELASTVKDVLQMRFAEDNGKNHLIPTQAELADPAKRDAFIRDVRNQARMMLVVKAFVGFISPGAPSMSIAAGDPYSYSANVGNSLSESGIRAELAQLIQDQGLNQGVASFIANHQVGGNGYAAALENPTAFLVQKTDKAAGGPISSTAQAMDYLDANSKVLDQNTAAAAWLLPPPNAHDAYDQQSYTDQIAHKLRTERSPDEFIKQLVFQENATTYFDSVQQYNAAKTAFQQRKDKVGERDLDARFTVWKDTFAGTNPLFWQVLTSPDAAQKRQLVIKQLDDALSSGSLPQLPHFQHLRTMLDSLDAYQTYIGELWNNPTTRARLERQQLKTDFANWGTQYSQEYPEMAAFWNAIIAPEAGVSQLDPTSTDTTSATTQLSDQGVSGGQ